MSGTQTNRSFMTLLIVKVWPLHTILTEQSPAPWEWTEVGSRPAGCGRSSLFASFAFVRPAASCCLIRTGVERVKEATFIYFGTAVLHSGSPAAGDDQTAEAS
ncbi:hypothetical protein SRHO_G00081990 [Serrasalmus rhombeus]